MDRRTFLHRAVQAMALVGTAIAAVPAAIVGLAPILRRRREREWRPVGQLQDFSVGRTHKALVNVRSEGDWVRNPARQAVYVARPDEQSVVVIARNCTDMSCPVIFDEGSNWFFCPCHGGIFDGEGNPRAGPPGRPLYRYDVRVRNGQIEIDINSVPPIV